MSKSHTIRLKVHPTLYDFYVSVYSTDTIHLSANSIFYEKVIATLEVNPAQYECLKVKSFKVLNIVLPATTDRGSQKIKIFNKDICDRHQELISRELYYLFKDIFHNYVMAYCRAKNCVPGCQKLAILDFCESYRIKEDKINYDMLKKSWDRSEQKKTLKFVK